MHKWPYLKVPKPCESLLVGDPYVSNEEASTKKEKFSLEKLPALQETGHCQRPSKQFESSLPFTMQSNRSQIICWVRGEAFFVFCFFLSCKHCRKPNPDPIFLETLLIRPLKPSAILFKF
jgi:hypothetical protein